MMHLVLSSDAAVSALAGGAVLGVSTITKLVINGNILGISGIVNGLCGVLVEPTSGPWGWRVAFTAGFLVAGAVLRAAAPQTLQALPDAMGWVRVVSAGALVGLGSSLGNGCTSGHGISGITRLSPRSIAATATFMATGILTASLSAASSAFTTTTATAEPAEPYPRTAILQQFAICLTARPSLTGCLRLQAARGRLRKRGRRCPYHPAGRPDCLRMDGLNHPHRPSCE